MQTSKKQILWDIVFVLLGSGLVAIGLAVFTVPNNIAPGGVSGIATAVARLTGLPVGMLALCFNIPLMLIAWRRMGLAPLAKTIASTILLSACIDLFGRILPAYQGDRLLAALTGGVIMGAGMGLLLVRGISTGGTDLVGLMIHESKPGISLGQLMLLIDCAVVAFAVIVFQDIEVALYSLVTIFVASKCIDVIQQGMDNAKVIYIITENPDALLERLAVQMGRGITVLPARGGFTSRSKNVLMTIARRNEVAITMQIIRELDPDAFTILSDATEVHGKGFKD